MITDGEANVTLVSEQDVLRELDAIALSMSREKFRVLVVDSSTGVVGNKFLQRLGNLVGGQYCHGRDLYAGRLFELIGNLEKG